MAFGLHQLGIMNGYLLLVSMNTRNNDSNKKVSVFIWAPD